MISELCSRCLSSCNHAADCRASHGGGNAARAHARREARAFRHGARRGAWKAGGKLSPNFRCRWSRSLEIGSTRVYKSLSQGHCHTVTMVGSKGFHFAAQFTSGFSRSFLPAFGPVLLTLVLDDPPEGSHMWVEAALRAAAAAVQSARPSCRPPRCFNAPPPTHTHSHMVPKILPC